MLNELFLSLTPWLTPLHLLLAQWAAALSGFFLVGFLVIFYLMIWRPQAKRAKEQKTLLGSLQKKGDEVVTTGGIAGKITKVSDDFVVLEVSDTVEMKFQKGAIAATLPKGTLKAI